MNADIEQAAADATKHEPPNTVDFDGLRDGRLDSHVKPRGRVGPCTRSPPATPVSDATSLLTTMVPLLTNLVQRTTAPQLPPTTPTKLHGSSKPHSPPLSPVPPPGGEIHACLEDFFKTKGIDLRQAEDTLTNLDLTPDIIADLSISRLNEVLDTVEGRARKYQVFTKDWSGRLECKCRCLN